MTIETTPQVQCLLSAQQHTKVAYVDQASLSPAGASEASGSAAQIPHNNDYGTSAAHKPAQDAVKATQCDSTQLQQQLQ
jgi:hypothetical protein